MCAPIPVSALALASDARLDGGREVRIRAVERDDGEAVQAFVARLSPATSRRRFFRPVKALTPSALARVVEVDYSRATSVVAEADGEIVGLAEYVAAPGERSAEVAVVVADQWSAVFTELARKEIPESGRSPASYAASFTAGSPASAIASSRSS
jgi:hypothetical protein